MDRIMERVEIVRRARRIREIVEQLKRLGNKPIIPGDGGSQV